jgi:hypothetical protein
MCTFQLHKIVSGGQTGVDRAALDAAIFLDIEHGGWCPRGRRAEDGRIPEKYQLREMEQRDYAVRTKQNVIDSDGTLILHRGKITGGTELTRRLAHKHHRQCLCIDLQPIDSLQPDTDLVDAERILNDRAIAKEKLLSWLKTNQIGVLNVAGPRESSAPGIASQAESFLIASLQRN